MVIKSKARITGLGAYLPSKKLTNFDLQTMVDTSDEWIVRRTGIRERRISEDDEFPSDLAIRAVEDLISKNNIKIHDVDMIIVTTFCPDHFTPTVSALVQGHFNISNAGTMDINAGCTGYVYGLCVADSLITSGHCNKVLVIASETVSKVIDYSDRNSCVLFGDAAVASLVERNEEKGSFLASSFVSDGNLAENVTCSNLSDSVNGHLLSKKRTFQQEGKLLYEYVVKNIPEGVRNLLNKCGLNLSDINWFVPHSANLRMIKAICERLDFSINNTLISNEYFGNTSSVTIPLAVWAATCDSKIKKGDKLLLYGFGGGLTHGGVIIEW
ncbi:MAG: 3-oxoacyl-(acyl-carrier-protein) synthase 3 protein 2 [Firmicutes bacterium ADurb.Bin419]|nr:MAG: 3-oxoacyl-(acyl-carrier-protein) synthase 3 protein 2 [Firmicutes bacterium ADurb.Bin419]